jgi:hypothetical protein
VERAAERWILAAVWVTLPVTAGGALADATAGWATAPQVAAAVLGWAAWAAALLAILVPRPWLLTLARAVAPGFVVVAIVVAVAGDVGAPEAGVAVAATLLAAVLVSRPTLAFLSANAAAYGDESRYPLRVPPGLFLGPVPLARLLLGAAVVAGPLLLADQRWVVGAIALVVGAPVAWFTARALHGLSTRWAVLVPAGFVVVDPFTLSDPVLFVRERITTLRAVGPDVPGPAVLDLRLGASLGGVGLAVDTDAELFRTRRSRRAAEPLRTRELWVATLASGRLLEEAAGRRLPVVTARAQAAKPPPTSSSPS